MALIVGVAILAGGISYYKAEAGKMCGGIAGNLPERQCAPGFRCRSEQPLFPDAAGTCTIIVPSFLYKFLPQPSPSNVILLEPDSSSDVTY